jgi:hypothetical protein
MIFKNPEEAFQHAIDVGALSTDPASPEYAGHYRYMGTQDNSVDAFKRIDTRQYLYVGE